MVADRYLAWLEYATVEHQICLLLQLTLLSVQRKVGNSCRHRTQQLTVQAGDDHMCVQAHVSMVPSCPALQVPAPEPLFSSNRTLEQQHIDVGSWRMPHGSVHVHCTSTTPSVHPRLVSSRARTPGDQSGHTASRQRQQQAESLVHTTAFAQIIVKGGNSKLESLIPHPSFLPKERCTVASVT